MKELTVTEQEAGQRLDKFLGRYLNEAGKGFLYKMLRKKNITLNGNKAEGSEVLNAGDTVKLFLSDDTIAGFRSAKTVTSSGNVTAKKLSVVYEDEDVLIINKPAGMLSQKARPDDVSLCEHAAAYLAARGSWDPSDSRSFTPGVLNRLDRNTSGLILASASLKGARELSALLRERSLKKYYLAVVRGIFTKEGVYSAWLIKDSETNTVKVSTSEVSGGEQIRTGIRVMQAGGGFSLLKIELITGKTHQIRAVLEHLGHPILGDPKYGEKDPALYVKRQLLHSYELVFPDQGFGLPALYGMHVKAAPPADFMRICKYLRLEIR